MPGSIGEEDDIIRGIKKRNRMYDMMTKSADTEKSPATGKLGNKRVSRADSSQHLDTVAHKRFKSS